MEAARTVTELDSIQQKIVAKRFDEALGDLDVLLAGEPDNADALYMSAVCCRYTGRYPAALEFLDRLKARAPEHGRAHQEEGHTCRDMGDRQRALIAYARACQFNPALEASWRGQLEILKTTNPQNAAAVQARLRYLENLPRPLVAVIDLIAQNKLLKAESLCREFLKKVPHHVEGMRLLADIALRLGVLDDAEFLLTSALKFEPDNVAVRMDLVRTLRKRQKFERSLAQARTLLDSAPENPQFQSLVAVESMQTGDYDTALALFDDVLAKLPGDPITLTSRGHALKTRGRYEDAVAAYRAAIAAQPQHGESWYALSNLKVYEFDSSEIDAMETELANPNLSHIDRVHLCFALGKAYEDRRDYERSFGFYERGNALKKVQARYDADRMSEDLAAQREVCSKALFDERAGVGCEAPDPIFIVGLPRAGSTLLEQILSSHSMVDGTLELPNILSLSQRLRRRARDGDSLPYPEVLAALSASELRDFGEEFIRDTRIHRKDAPFFIDKMPNNFRHIALIHLILPNAKIIDARREPMACCFSGFKQLFAEGQEFTYGLKEVGGRVTDQVAFRVHWDAVLPGKVLRVQYEDIVADLDAQVARLLEHCGLPFEDACIEFHRTERSVRTPSSEQVRQPIYRSGLEQWRNYDAHLAPLESALGPVLDRYPTEQGQ